MWTMYLQMTDDIHKDSSRSMCLLWPPLYYNMLKGGIYKQNIPMSLYIEDAVVLHMSVLLFISEVTTLYQMFQMASNGKSSIGHIF